MILEADFTEDNIEQGIQDIVNYIAEKRVPFSWRVAHFDKTSDLENRLVKAVLRHTETHAGMHLD